MNANDICWGKNSKRNGMHMKGSEKRNCLTAHNAEQWCDNNNVNAKIPPSKMHSKHRKILKNEVNMGYAEFETREGEKQIRFHTMRWAIRTNNQWQIDRRWHISMAADVHLENETLSISCFLFIFIEIRSELHCVYELSVSFTFDNRPNYAKRNEYIRFGCGGTLHALSGLVSTCD